MSEHLQRLVNATQTAMSPHFAYTYNAGTHSRGIDIIIFDETKEVTHFSISWLPGNVHVVIFHDVVVDPTKRSKGLGDFFHRLRLIIAKEFGATIALCTTRNANSVENKILTKNDWTRVLPIGDGVTLWANELGVIERK